MAKCRGEKYCDFIERLTVPEGDTGNQPLRLVPWQRQFIMKLFGAMNAEQRRQFRNALLFIPKKNGKSVLVAAICVAALFLEKEIGGQIYSVANSRDQAKIIYRAAVAMIQNNAWLRKNCEIRESKNTIYNPATRTIYKALSAESGDKNGLCPSIFLADEIAEWQDRELFGKLRTGMLPRKEPLIISMTTAGIDRNTVGYEIYQHAKSVAEDPSRDPTFLPVIYEAPVDCDWTDLSVWKKANPSYGYLWGEAEAKQEIAQAQGISTRVNDVLRYNLNIWVDGAQSWIPADKWTACDETITEEELKGRSCWIGLDLASVQDMTVANLIFPLDDGKIVSLPRYYLPKATAAERQRIDHVPYLTWLGKYILPTNGNATDYDFVRADINSISGTYKIEGIAIDRNLQGGQLGQQLQSDGFDVLSFGLGYYSMTPPCKELERLVLEKKLIHNQHPVLAWNARNVTVDTDKAGNLSPNKSKSREKIDGIVALLMGLGLYMAKRKDEEQSVYADRGILFI